MSLRPARFRASLAALAVLAAVLGLAGCEREPEAPADEAPLPDAALPANRATAEAGDGIDATHVVDRAPVAGAGGDFDVRAFAGAFGTDGLRVDLAADGTYTLAAGAVTGTGTWSVEADGARIRLDPDSKAEADRVYALVSDELVSDDDGQVLRRVGD